MVNSRGLTLILEHYILVHPIFFFYSFLSKSKFVSEQKVEPSIYRTIDFPIYEFKYEKMSCQSRVPPIDI